KSAANAAATLPYAATSSARNASSAPAAARPSETSRSAHHRTSSACASATTSPSAAASPATSAALATPLTHLRHHRKIPARRLRGRRQRRESLLRVGAAPIGQRAGDLLLVQAKQLQTDLGVGQPRNRRQLLHPGIGLRRP